jgi:thiol-disulfide isomerase/thioredoxin
MKTKNIILILVMFVIVVSIFFLEGSKVKINPTIQETSTENDLVDSQYNLAPELVGITGYINTEEIKISDFRGKVVLIDFWTYSCINCIRTFPHLNSWHEKYNDEGLVIIGVHTPEFEFEKDYNNVKAAAEKYNIKYAIVQDNSFSTWTAFNNRFWPRKYLIDSQGFLRYDHIGEGGYEETELKIQELLAESGNIVSNQIPKEVEKFRLGTTPELYAGYNFALPRFQDIGNSQGLIPDETFDYIIPKSRDPHTIYISGLWKSNPDDLEIKSPGSIMLNFTASSVNIVASSSVSQNVNILINGEMQHSINVDFPELYNVYEGNYGSYELTLEVSDGFAFNAFTFG